MMRSVFATLFFVSLWVGWAPSAFTQSYYALISRAEMAYMAEEYRLAAESYQRAFVVGTPTAGDLYNAACCFALTGQVQTAFYQIEQAVEAGWVDVGMMLRDSDLRALRNAPEWEESLAELRERVAVRKAEMNLSLMVELETMQRADRRHRALMDSVLLAAGRSSAAWDSLMNCISTTDRTNVARLTGLLDAHGWPSYTEVGRAGSRHAALILSRADVTTQERYLPLLVEAAGRGEADWQQAAELQDLVLMQKGKPQWYGSQVVYRPETQRYEPYKIKKERLVNRRRHQVGLPPLDEYVRVRNLMAGDMMAIE
ncbi:MAG: DUF6624 domain-containing protein [Catalinimonas sp.]